ncbi:looped-hinge helix DNA binding domain, AbrB family [Metallosphaera yellowstonensis MK1]|uniref:Looped-hinge helix DNA binding domain, AbrB family n=1 Tax=Metallosphaera yellowstonensis MK1 TaxID=671065 RepID=H2C2G0_9CREN|nr:AbrB/MazE/SpoVT family DNA-binding domain-containing protein [Metallosphaera yellowstonensis]EHP70431.1 looped-hinge helix DNA binding domain, AbrB family [Metallosphaera yellowstonensis MK1]
MERVKVTRNYQVTIPASIRNRLGIHEGDILEFYVEEDEIIIKKVSTVRPRIKLGRKLTIEEIERDIERGLNESSH